MAIRTAIVGAGPGGYVAAVRAAQLGAEVTVVERESVGGTCLNRGCIPSKVMIAAAQLLDRIRRAGEFGVRIDGAAHLDIQGLMARKARVIRDQSKGILDLFHHHKIRYVRGEATIAERGALSIRGVDGQTLEVPWDRLILAPGARPYDFPSFPFDGERILSSDDALCIREIPESIMILGGGVIGCEFAFLFASLGSRVTVVEAMDRLLPIPSIDEDCSKILQREMKKRKIKFMAKRTVEGVEHCGGGLRITIAPSPFADDAAEREPIVLQEKKLLVCIGRRPNTAGIGIEKLGVKLDPGGWIVADERMETSAPGVYAVGDALGPSRIMLAHTASSEGLTAAENSAGGNCVMDYTVVPGAIFTVPEVANVGLSEARARELGYNVRADSVLFRNLGKAQVMGEIAGEAKIVSEAETGRILGVHMVGPHVTDLIAEGALAVKMACTVKDLAETIHAHPTLAEVMLETSFKSLGKSLHG